MVDCSQMAGSSDWDSGSSGSPSMFSADSGHSGGVVRDGGSLGSRTPDPMSSKLPSSSSGSSSSLSAFSCVSSKIVVEDGQRFILHDVSKLDTLAGLAIKYGVEVGEIKRINRLTMDYQMFAQKTLKIPLPGPHPPSPALVMSPPHHPQQTPRSGCMVSPEGPSCKTSSSAAAAAAAALVEQVDPDLLLGVKGLRLAGDEVGGGSRRGRTRGGKGNADGRGQDAHSTMALFLALRHQDNPGHSSEDEPLSPLHAEEDDDEEEDDVGARRSGGRRQARTSSRWRLEPESEEEDEEDGEGGKEDDGDAVTGNKEQDQQVWGGRGSEGMRSRGSASSASAMPSSSRLSSQARSVVAAVEDLAKQQEPPAQQPWDNSSGRRVGEGAGESASFRDWSAGEGGAAALGGRRNKGGAGPRNGLHGGVSEDWGGAWGVGSRSGSGSLSDGGSWQDNRGGRDVGVSRKAVGSFASRSGSAGNLGESAAAASASSGLDGWAAAASGVSLWGGKVVENLMSRFTLPSLFEQSQQAPPQQLGRGKDLRGRPQGGAGGESGIDLPIRGSSSAAGGRGAVSASTVAATRRSSKAKAAID